MSFHCESCPPGGVCEQCKKRNAEQKAAERARKQPATMTQAQAEAMAVEIIRIAVIHYGGQDPWLLADDSEYDELAVRIATRGERRVMLTYVERVAAAVEILQARGTLHDVCVRLSLPIVVTEVEWKRKSAMKIARRLLDREP